MRSFFVFFSSSSLASWTLTPLACSALLATALTGCFGETLNVGSNDAGPTVVAPTQPPTDDAGPSTADAGPAASIPTSHGPPYSAAEIAGAVQTCSAPHGPLDTPATIGDLESRLVGSWYLCSTSDPSEDTVKSMEFDADGNWYNLLDDGNGGLARGQGVDNQGTYQPTNSSNGSDGDAGPDASTDGFVYRYRGAGAFLDFMYFEKAPKRLNIEEGTSGFEEWFVYLGPSSP